MMPDIYEEEFDVNAMIAKIKCNNLDYGDDHFSLRDQLDLLVDYTQELMYGEAILDEQVQKFWEDSMQPFLTALKCNSTIKVLDLSSTEMENEDALRIIEALEENQTVLELDLSGNYIDDEGAALILKCLRNNRRLQKLNLSKNYIGVESAEHIAEFMNPIEQKMLLQVLQRQSIGEDTAIHYSNYLKNPLVSLNLSENEISDECVQRIAQALSQNRSLQNLDISQNQITDQGAEVMAKVIVANGTLVELSLDNNSISEGGIVKLAKAFEKSSLKKLHMEFGLLEK